MLSLNQSTLEKMNLGTTILVSPLPRRDKSSSQHTTNNVGHYLGIVLDKVVISAPKVKSPITDGSGVISGSFTREQANSLAVYLRVEGPLPIPLKVKQVSEIGK